MQKKKQKKKQKTIISINVLDKTILKSWQAEQYKNKNNSYFSPFDYHVCKFHVFFLVFFKLKIQDRKLCN